MVAHGMGRVAAQQRHERGEEDERRRIEGDGDPVPPVLDRHGCPGDGV